MLRFKILIILVLSIYSLRPSTTTILAQQKAPDQELLNNIEIMETVLDKLISPQKSRVSLFDSNTRGYYLMNYGIIFNVSYSLFNRGIISIDIDKRLKMKNNYIFVNEEDKEISKDLEKEMDQLKSRLVRFLGEWTAALSSLRPDEKVTVIINFNGFLPTIRNTLGYSAHQLIASVPIKEIANYRKGRIAQEEFENKITFDEVKSMDEDISIISNVIQTSLRHTDKQASFGWSGDVKGIYFKGYGVIFFTDLTFGSIAYKNAITLYSEALKKSKGRSITFESISNESADQEKNVKKIEQKLIHIVSNYGHNLRSLQPNEWVEIAINFKGMPVKDKYSKSILKVQKKIIDDYNRDRIKFDQFKNKVRIIYY